MNEIRRYEALPLSDHPLIDPLDTLLVDIAINVQLPPGLHAEACDRFTAVQAHMERPGSPLHDRVLRFYAQGSMAIDATTSTRGTDDEYDLDGVAELDVPPWLPPKEVHDLVWDALKGYPVSKVTRQTRCTTLTYADGMHIDITPQRRSPGTQNFEGVIFHAKLREPRSEHAEVPMNAWGFAQWYTARTPMEERFSQAYNARLREAGRPMVKAEAIVHDVPEQVPLPLKSVTTVALQLIKRFRNIWMNGRPGRPPPSVMLSCHAGHAALPGMRLSDMVIRQARWTARAIRDASRLRRKLDVRNPVMPNDCFTDRWPEDLRQQDEFATALNSLADGLEAIQRGTVELEDAQEWLRGAFGQRVVSRSIETLNERNGRAIGSLSQNYTRTGGLYVPAAPAIVGVSSPALASVTPRTHTNMGERR